MKALDFTNQKINKLKVLKKVESKKNRTFWLCECDCGRKVEVMTQDLKYKTKYSCGCCRKPYKKINYKYPSKNQKLYNVWNGIKSRCYRKNDKMYKYYGGRGINMCDEWLNNFMSFQEWAVNNGYVEGLTIDRIDNNKDYCPANCRWVTIKENNINRRGIIKINYNNEIICLKDYCRIKNISYYSALKKYKRGELLFK